MRLRAEIESGDPGFGSLKVCCVLQSFAQGCLFEALCDILACQLACFSSNFISRGGSLVGSCGDF